MSAELDRTYSLSEPDDGASSRFLRTRSMLDSALGVAVGQVAAGCVLIAAAVILTRLRRRAAVAG